MFCHPERSKCFANAKHLRSRRIPFTQAQPRTYRGVLSAYYRPLSKTCHSVSNDAMPCQAFCGDTSASTLEAAPFRSRRKVFDDQTKLVTLFNPAAGPQVPPSISSGLAPTITHFDLPDSLGRQAAHSSARLLLAGHRMTRAHLHDGLT